jgi:photosystem II stability/assembly factor-like uncharacterized protein
MVPFSASAQQLWYPDTVGFSQPVGSLAVDAGGNIFAGAFYVFHAVASANGVWHSQDGGRTWTQTPKAPSEFPLGPVYGINPKGTNANGDVFVGGSYEYRTTDEGTSWQEIHILNGGGADPGLNNFAAVSTGSNTSRVLFSTGTTGLQVSNQNGISGSWTEIGDGGVDHPIFVASTPSGMIFQIRNSGEIDTSTSPNGSYWSQSIGGPSLGSNPAFASNNNGLIVAGGTNGVWFSTNDGIAWTQMSPSGINGQTHLSLAVQDDGKIFAGMSTGGMYEADNAGASWTDLSTSGLPSDTIYALALGTGGIVYGGTNYGVFEYAPFGGVANSNTVSSFSLDQNTPNPVVTNASIHFTVAASGPVSLQLFDETGREIESLASGFYAPGSYNVLLDARTLANGVYYYRILSGDKSASRMVVIAH